MNFRLIKILTSCGLFASVVALMLTLNYHIMYYEEQHRLFLFTWQYAVNTIHEIGFLQWLSNFLIQFYHIPWLGASIIGLLLVAVYLLWESIVKKLTGLRDYLQTGVILSFLLYFSFNQADTTPVALIAVILILTAVRIIFIFIPQLPWTKNAVSDKEKLKPLLFALPLVLALGYIGYSVFKAMKAFTPEERAIVLVQKAAKEKDWDKVIKIAEPFLSVQPNNKLMLYLRSLALANKGELLDKLFDYPLPDGVGNLILSWKENILLIESGYLVHESTGSLNDAVHWVFEALSMWGETSQNLINLAKYNIAIGKPKVAQRFVNKLKHSLFYRKEAAFLQRQIDGEEAPEVHYAFAGDPLGSSRLIEHNPARNLQQILEADPGNKVAEQYFLASLLLLNDQDAIVEYLKPGRQYSSLVEQALLVYSFYPDAKPLNELGLSYSKKTMDAFVRYSDLVQKKQLRSERLAFGNSFWYYIAHVCPTGYMKQSTLKSTQSLPDNVLNH